MRRSIAPLPVATMPLAALAATPQTAVLDVKNMTCEFWPVTVKEVAGGGARREPGADRLRQEDGHRQVLCRQDEYCSIGQRGERRRPPLDGAQMTTGAPVLEWVLTCPQCGHAKTEIMPTDACQFLYECAHCKTVLRPLAGDCCVFCSYGSAKCPPMQMQQACSSCRA